MLPFPPRLRFIFRGDASVTSPPATLTTPSHLPHLGDFNQFSRESKARKACDCFSLRQFCIIINIPSLRNCLQDVEGNLRSNTGGGAVRGGVPVQRQNPSLCPEPRWKRENFGCCENLPTTVASHIAGDKSKAHPWVSTTANQGQGDAG